LKFKKNYLLEKKSTNNFPAHVIALTKSKQNIKSQIYHKGSPLSKIQNSVKSPKTHTIFTSSMQNTRNNNFFLGCVPKNPPRTIRTTRHPQINTTRSPHHPTTITTTRDAQTVCRRHEKIDEKKN
jgi:hypothetical protein